MISYKKEYAMNDDSHNILTLVKHQNNVDLRGALQWLAERHSQIEARFLSRSKELPSWGRQIDEQVRQYIDRLARIARANYDWSFESGRYFGEKGLEYQKTRRVPLVRKTKIDPGR
jgi:hypothetical protein